MKIKNKTKLRKYLLSCRDSVGEWDFIEINDDGYWGIVNANTYTPNIYSRTRVDYFLYRYTPPFKNTTLASINKSITKTFQMIERGLI